MNYWVISITEDNWFIVREKNKFGVRKIERGIRAYELIKPGDVLIFYVMKRGAEECGGMFVGAFEVISDWYQEREVLWPDEGGNTSKGLYLYRVSLKPIRLGRVSLKELLPKLLFTQGKKPGIYLKGTPANFGRPIPEEDAKLIIESLR